MGVPNPRFKGTTYLITRRCTQRKYLARPSEKNNQILLFCMIHAANKYKIDIHAYVFMGNHYHIILTDPHRNLAKFMAWLNQFSSKCLNHTYHRWENVWNSSRYGAVTLREGFGEDPLYDSEEVIEKIIYTLANPVQAGLVNRGYKWPGAWSPPMLMASGYIEAERPKYFSEYGVVPKRVRMKLCPPPGFSHMSPEEFVKMINKQLKEKEDEIQKLFKAQGRKFIGAKRIRAQNPESRPRTQEAHRQLNPRVACKDKWKRIEILKRLKHFWAAYKEAFDWFCAGKRDVVFPAGTYKMVELYDANCEVRLHADLTYT